MINSCHDRGVASINRPAVKMVVGQGTPKAGILVTLRCCTTLMAGYTNEYTIKTHATAAQRLGQAANDRRPFTTPHQRKSAACTTKSAANSPRGRVDLREERRVVGQTGPGPMHGQEGADPASVRTP